MKTKFILATFVATLGGLVALVTPASASPDIQVRVNLPRPPVIVINGRDRDRDHNRGDSGYVLQNRLDGGAPRKGVYGNYWYDQQKGGGGRHSNNQHSAPPAPQGYWKEVGMQVWVPAHWEYGYDNYGRQIRTFQLGRNEYRTRRIWVDGCR